MIEAPEIARFTLPDSACGNKLDKLAWVAHRSYEIGNLRFGVRTTSQRFASWIDEVLAPYLVESLEDPLYSIVIGTGDDHGEAKSKRDYHIMYRGVWPTVRTFDLAALGYAFLIDLETKLFATRSDLVFLDGMAVELKDKVALLPGSALPGLAQLGRRAGSYGLRLAPMMGLAIDPDSGKIAPFVRQVLPEADATNALEALGHKGDIPEFFVVREPIQPDIVAAWDSRRGLAFEPLSRAETLHHLAGDTFNFEQIGGRVLPGLARLVEGADCYGLVPMSTPDLAKGLAALA